MRFKGLKRGRKHVTTFDANEVHTNDTVEPTGLELNATIGWTSSDGRRAFSKTIQVTPPSPPKKRPRIDDPPTNTPPIQLPLSDEQRYTVVDDIDEAFENDHAETRDENWELGLDNDESTGSTIKAKKRYASSDDPLKQWIPLRDEYMKEFISLESIPSQSNTCTKCKQQTETVFRCNDCFGEQTLCQTCCCSSHVSHPLHRVEKWNGRCFQATTLKDLGLRVQLGHPNGVACSSPSSVPHFVVIHVNGLHIIHLDFCGCEKIEEYGHPRQQLLRRRWFPATVAQPHTCATFHLLDHFSMNTLQGKITMYDYYSALEKLTDNTLENPPPYRMKEFTRIHREYRHICSLIQAGRAHICSGISGTVHGELTVSCPACPRPGINLPSGWDIVPGAKRFLYTLFIALDACFRLKRRLVSSVKKDPGLGIDWGYFVEREPFRKYILGVTDQKEISTCSGLAALDYANTKFSRGYAATGVCLGVCARHEFIQKSGAADLQVGERYANVDYCFASLMRHHDPRLNVVVSYDIACQWGKNAISRLEKLPPLVRLCVGLNHIRFAIPKLHIHSHTKVCQRTFSLNYLPGVGRTDGEGIERPWANIGGTATSTRVMGPGARVETLNSHWSHWNWQKLIGLGGLLKKRLSAAVNEQAIQQESFEAFSSKQVEHIPEWKRMVVDYERDSSKPNPYYVEKQGITENQVRLKFAQEDAEAMSTGQVTLAEVSPSAFIREGLEIETLQRRIQAESTSKNFSTTSQELDLVEMRSRVARRMSKFRLLQAAYMPCVLPILATRSVSEEEEVESVPLYLPSALTSTQQLQCLGNVCAIEAEFREGECQSALDGVRNGLFIKARLLGYKNRNARHQTATTRTRTLIARNESKTALHVLKYQNAWTALTTLPESLQRLEKWPKLNAEDVRCMEDAETLTKKHVRRERRVENGRADAVETAGDGDFAEGERVVPKEGYRTISWIWAESSEEDNEVLRVEWAKAWARVRRWTEEIELLKEEMRRTLVSLQHQATEWERRAEGGGDNVGMSAYAYRQARIYNGIADAFEKMWKNQPEREKPGQANDVSPASGDPNDNASEYDEDDGEGAEGDEDDDDMSSRIR